jgi:hypothetical protein
MKEIENKVYIIMGKHGKVKAAEMIGISFITLKNRLKGGNWKKSEILIIDQLTKE